MKNYPTRQALFRVSRIHDALASGRYPNARTLAEEIEVSERCVMRDIEYMRDVLGSPIEYDAVKHGYYYAGDGHALPTARLTEGELVSLLVGTRVLEQYRGTPFEMDLRHAFTRISTLLPESVTVQVGEMASAVSFSCSAPRPPELARFRLLMGAIAKRRRLLIRYEGVFERRRSERTIDPYHMTCIDGAWYLIAYCHLRRSIRMFVPDRIIDARETGETFAKPPKFDANEFMAGAFRVMRGGRRQRIRLQFTGPAAAYVSERKWHTTQRLRVGPRNGNCVIEMTLTSLEEVAAWAMSFGGACRVLAPAALRRLVADGHKAGHHLNAKTAAR